MGDPFSEARANVLADLAAKRRLIASAERDREWDEAAGFDSAEAPQALAVMALHYSAHQDYQDGWRPAPT